MLDNGRRTTKWNDGALRTQIDLTERPAGYPESAPFPADDVGFVDAMVGELGSNPPDRSRARVRVRFLQWRQLHGTTGR